jgi:hypothetical protein
MVFVHADLDGSLTDVVRNLTPVTSQSLDATRFASTLSSLLSSSKSHALRANQSLDADGLVEGRLVPWPDSVRASDAKRVAYALVTSAAQAAVARDRTTLMRRLVELQQFVALEAAAAAAAALLAAMPLTEVQTASIPTLELGSGDASESECTSPRRRAAAVVAARRCSFGGGRGDIISDDSYASAMSICGGSGGVAGSPSSAAGSAQVEEVLCSVSAALDDTLAADFGKACKASAALAGTATAAPSLAAVRESVDAVRLAGLSKAAAAEIRIAGLLVVALPNTPPALLSAALRPRLHAVAASTPSAHTALHPRSSSGSAPSHPLVNRAVLARS